MHALLENHPTMPNNIQLVIEPLGSEVDRMGFSCPLLILPGRLGQVAERSCIDGVQQNAENLEFINEPRTLRRII